MAFTSQFSLSLELTRLVPLGILAAGKGYEAAVRIARELQGSGSDLIVEEDMAELFGRSRIADLIASSFRTTMSMPDPPRDLGNGLALFRGPGPTVNRALTQPAYFPTVVQCSFLTYVHETATLAECIARYLENIAEGAPSGTTMRAVPSTETIRGMLQACEDQTAAYDWSKHLWGVGAILKLDPHRLTSDTIPSIIVHGLLNMLPLTQHLPDHYIVIESRHGLCSIVVWANVLLNLAVSVRVNPEKDAEVFHFPSTNGTDVQVFIDASGRQTTDSITLFSHTPEELLFRLKADDDDEVIDATRRAPARGIISREFSRIVPDLQGKDRVLEEMFAITCSFALLASNSLFVAREGASPDRLMPHVVERGHILEAAKLLFDVYDREMVLHKIQYYEVLYTGRGLWEHRDPPSSIKPFVQEWQAEGHSDLWHKLNEHAIAASSLILAFAHVSDIGKSGNMPLSDYLRLRPPLDLRSWDGSSRIPIRQDIWFASIAEMMIGHIDTNFGLQETCLIAAAGWSVYINTFGDADPAYLSRCPLGRFIVRKITGLTNAEAPGGIAIRRGVPWRKGVSKHRVVDGPCIPELIDPEDSGPHIEGRGGETTPIRCTTPTTFGTPVIGERGDSFLVSLRLQETQDTANHGSRGTQRTGYNELWGARFVARKTAACSHPILPDTTLLLESNWIALTGLQFAGFKYDKSRVRLCLTLNDRAARWKALVNLSYSRWALVRGPDCCFQCAAIQGAIQQYNDIFVVL